MFVMTKTLTRDGAQRQVACILVMAKMKAPPALGFDDPMARAGVASLLPRRLPEQQGAARCVLEDVGRRLAHVELAEALPVGHAHDDEIGLPLPDLVDDRRARLAGLQELGGDLDLRLR